MTQALWFIGGFSAGFSLMAWSRAHVVSRLQRDNALLEQSRQFWMGESLRSPAQEAKVIQQTLDAIEKQIVGDSGDGA